MKSPEICKKKNGPFFLAHCKRYIYEDAIIIRRFCAGDRNFILRDDTIATSEDIKAFLLNNLECLKGKRIDEFSDEESGLYQEMRIPNNMFIWATMNSADQGVFPMDTAFKRRWEFEYIGVDDEAKEVEKYIIPIGDKEHRKYVKWNDLRERINDILSSDDCKVNE